ncbi:hypothetical protein [Marinobacter sp. CHS3-4]|uniref:hypothetical protein n=1 Tax=Marinobacter sp. CHS3-4 TaxID=3045174 RepID=UPI0024B61792|nr:hypothetical protein [Marinobacter sp. CHS3-4]MDI9245321.1 hypothetical protein [Marinobacter sp. CHS3-4]
MKRISIGAMGALAFCSAFSVLADTEKVDSALYWVQIAPGQTVDMPSGAKGKTVIRNHATVVQANGNVASQWCTGHQGVDGSGAAGGAGYCTSIYDNGDMVYFSYLLGAEDEPATWTVMGGTGAYEGATGSGTSTITSQRADGRAWTSQARGSITTK